jgi:hypothetical protein
MTALDPVGNVSLILQVVILFLLIMGLPLVRGANRGPDAKKNFMRHGYLTVLALLLNTVLIFTVMVPSFAKGLGELGGLSFLDSFNVWSHVVLGTIAEALAIIIIVPWLYKHSSTMTCAKLKKWMWLTLIIWVISVLSGALIHILGML